MGYITLASVDSRRGRKEYLPSSTDPSLGSHVSRPSSCPGTDEQPVCTLAPGPVQCHQSTPSPGAVGSAPGLLCCTRTKLDGGDAETLCITEKRIWQIQHWRGLSRHRSVSIRRLNMGLCTDEGKGVSSYKILGDFATRNQCTKNGQSARSRVLCEFHRLKREFVHMLIHRVWGKKSVQS